MLKSPQTKRLVDEFEEKLDLNSVDARRAAFVVLTLAKGWRKAKIARYLGVSRARVGQRAVRYEQCAETGQFPVIAEVLADSRPTEKGTKIGASLNESQWKILSFADDLLNRLV